ncbi:hypothetical protein H8S95_16960 [Pontibacter sp. KCTC 32443]|uniref:SGNH/GDSL hydrolase family protein n=1 Tax=Pontibacter TaxID=323449 RepID=UPI00164DBA7C|nr:MULTISPECIES: SGNH/GDSL hydrolase family protein [Pontibacter]MBC5775767.1 hypothetical protein [Pontibacter sp. KCTC 32443]
MKNFIYKSGVLALFAGVLLTSCDPEIDSPSPSAGEADFTTYVALGNSLTAGFADGALYREGQQNSYPAILSRQFALVGASDPLWTQPLLPAGVSLGSPRQNAEGQFEVPQQRVLRIVNDCKNVPGLSPVEAGAPAPFPQAFLGAAPQEPSPFNNMGVPGAKSFHLLAPGYGNPAGLANGTANPFFVRFASSPTTSVIADAMAQSPTFFTLWIGNNDVLGYALAGGVPVAGEKDYPTDKTQFAGAINLLINQLTSNGAGAKGAVGNIPSVDKIPYFTTIPYNGLNLTAEQATQLTAAYAQAGLTHITFQAGANAFVVLEDGIPRKATSNELILLPASDLLKCQGFGSQKPLDDKYVLSEAELETIRDYTASYNQSIAAAAQGKGLALADFNAYMNRIATGFTLNGVTYSSTFVSGNIFSLDGIHFTQRGAALAANEFIDAINKTYNSRIPKVDETQFSTVVFP